MPSSTLMRHLHAVALGQREGMASVMFSDIVNSTSLAAALGDHHWAVTVRRHLTLVESIVKEGGGQVVKTLGEGAMSTFASASDALLVAQKIQIQNANERHEPQLVLRVGIDSGDVIQTEDDFFGSVANKAARIASVAAPGEIRVSEATLLLAGSRHEFQFDIALETELKGFDGNHLLYRLDW
jgi:adenylate cyclase